MLDALADGDVSQVLVALSTLLAGGWGPQQLATELIDDLRQVFLAALAPELCAVSGSSLERFRALAETMGLARVVRSMEILGHALVDMREAPDAQVVLEIAVVRAVRPDLDSGIEALSERVSVLERSFPATPPSRRPGGAGQAAAGGAPLRAEPEAAEPPPRRPAGTWAGVPPSAPCAGASRPQVPRRPRPHRKRTGAGPEAVPVPPADLCPRHPGACSTAAIGGPAVDRDSLTEAWGDGILQSLPARAKALYAQRPLRRREPRGRPLRTAQRGPP